MCVKSHYLYNLLASRRRAQGLSQEALANRAGMRREKVNRIESKGEQVGLDEFCRLLDVVGLELSVQNKKPPNNRYSLGAGGQANPHGQVPSAFDEASLVDGSRARIVDWGKIPK